MTNKRKKKEMKRYAARHHIPVPRGFAINERWGRPAQRLATAIREHMGCSPAPYISAHDVFEMMPAGEKVVRIAMREVGVIETPPGSNWGSHVEEYLRAAGVPYPAPWCGAFVRWCVVKAGLRQCLPPNPAYVPSWEEWAEREGLLVPKASARRGDLVTFQFDTDEHGDHIGIIVKNLVVAKEIVTVEGNAADAVRRLTRPWYSVNKVIRLRPYCHKCGRRVK